MHRGTLRDLSNLGYVHQQLGEYAKAETLYREALQAKRQTVGEKDPAYQVKEGQTAGDQKKATSTGYKFDDDDMLVNQLKVFVRKALAERPGGMESIKRLASAAAKPSRLIASVERPNAAEIVCEPE